MVNGACLYSVSVWIRDLCNVLRLKNSFHNWDWYSLMWFAWISMLVLTWWTYTLSIIPLALFDSYYRLSTVHDSWLSHCKSSWSCMNWKLSSKHLYVAQAVVRHAARICASKRWSEGPLLRDGRQVNKLSNLLCLTRCGFYDCLEEGGLVGPNMGTWCRAHELATATISNIAPVRTKTEKLLQYILASAAMLSFETVLHYSFCCLWSCMVGFIQVPNPCNGDLL